MSACGTSAPELTDADARRPAHEWSARLGIINSDPTPSGFANIAGQTKIANAFIPVLDGILGAAWAEGGAPSSAPPSSTPFTPLRATKGDAKLTGTRN